MPMINANDPTFFQLYPNGCTVYDRLGRRLTNVVACNPETGEVITHSLLPLVCRWARLRWAITGEPRLWQPRGELAVIGGELLRRHGFWPAPLKVVRIGRQADDKPALMPLNLLHHAAAHA
jgi:hypothetical protein